MYDAQKEFKNLCNQMSKDIVKPFLKQKENIYIDSDLLYHYRLGAMLALTKSEDDFNYVREHINDYLEAPTLECAKFFPEMKLTDEDLDKFIVDPKYFNVISAISPASEFIDNFDKIIRIFNTINESKEVTDPITITINQRRIPIHPVYRRGIINRIRSIDRHVNVKFTSYKSWYEVPQSLIAVQDFLCVYDMIEFLKEGTNSQKAISAVPSQLATCCIVTPLQADVPDPSFEHFRNLKVLLEVMCDKFSYISKTIINS